MRIAIEFDHRFLTHFWSYFRPFWEPLGVILALLLALGVENAKISKFANSQHENLDFQGSGGFPGQLFGA